MPLLLHRDAQRHAHPRLSGRRGSAASRRTSQSLDLDVGDARRWSSRAASRAASRSSTAPTPGPLLDAGWPADAVKEIAFLAADNVFFNRISTLPALPPEEMDLADRWFVRLLRPLLARRLRPRRTTERAAAHARATTRARSPPASTRSTGCPAPRACAPSSTMRGAPRACRGAPRPWSSRSWRAASAARSPSRKPARLLAAEGMPPAAIEHALAHLSGPALDPLDTAAASLARESIWYRPAQIQRHAAVDAVAVHARAVRRAHRRRRARQHGLPARRRGRHRAARD